MFWDALCSRLAGRSLHCSAFFSNNTLLLSLLCCLSLYCFPTLTEAASKAKATKAAPDKPVSKAVKVSTPLSRRPVPTKRQTPQPRRAVPRPKPTPEDAPKPKKIRPNRTEFSVLPVLGYSTDRGFRFGAYAVIARFKEGYYPYLWRLYFRLAATVNQTPEGQTIFPMHEDFIRLDFPGLFDGKLRLNLRLGFFRFTTTGYYGVGNNSLKLPDKPSSYYQLDRINPEAAVDARIQLLKRGRGVLNLVLGTNLIYNVTNLQDRSQVLDDIRTSRLDTEKGLFLRNYLRGFSNHFLLRFNAGLLWDSRNHEFAPSAGNLSEIAVRGSGGFDIASPYLGITGNFRFYISLWKEYLVLAVRLLTDVLVGQPPYYELYSYGGLFAQEGPGGGYSIRGVLAQRYYGKIKLIGNVELRSKIIPLTFLGQRFNLGLVAFLDAGRVWADFSYKSSRLQEMIDGATPGIKWAVGGGGRLQWGSTVVMRADVGYSPSDRNLGVFFVLSHMF